YAQDFDIREKTDRTPVTAADIAAERIIEAMLEAAFPDIPILAEERCEAEGLPPSAPCFWAVDPLDGTREFIARNGEFAVSIGLVEAGRPVLGVVHGPAKGLTYTACAPGAASPRPARRRESRTDRGAGARPRRSRRRAQPLAREQPAARRVPCRLSGQGARQVRQRPQIRRARGRRGRPLSALWQDDGVGHGGRP